MSQHPFHSSHQGHAGSSSPAPASGARGNVRAACDADIAKRAYQKFEARGRTHGLDREDWAAASHEIITETFGPLSLSPRRAISGLPDLTVSLGA